MDPKPPPWGDDALSFFFSQAEFNDRVAALNYPAEYQLLQYVHAIFVDARAAVEKDNQQVLVVPRMLLVRSHAAFLGAIRLAMSGQIPETFPVLRLTIELVWYALHIAKDPAAPQRALIWLKRGDSEGDTQACRREFQAAKVRKTHEQIDLPLAQHLQKQYESMIDMGAHPSQLGLFSSAASIKVGNETTYQIGILYPTEFPLLATLGLSVGVALDVLRTFQLIFPERFKIMGIDARVDAALANAQQLFTHQPPANPLLQF